MLEVWDRGREILRLSVLLLFRLMDPCLAWERMIVIVIRIVVLIAIILTIAVIVGFRVQGVSVNLTHRDFFDLLFFC